MVAELESLTDAPEPANSNAEPTNAGEAAAEPAATPEPVAASPADSAPTEPAPDAETSRRLATVQKAEERSRQAIQKERADALAEIQRARDEIARMQAEWSPKLEAFERLKTRAKYEPDAVLAELGVDDWEHASKAAFLRSKAASDKPESRDAYLRSVKQREHEDRLARIERENAELRQSIVQREQQQTFAQQQSMYLDATVKAANDEAPLLATLATKNPDKARTELWATAQAIFEATGEVPEPSDLVAAYEQKQRAALESLGIDITTVTKKKPAPVAPTRPAATLPAAPSGATPVPNGKKTRAEIEAEVLADLQSGKNLD